MNKTIAQLLEPRFAETYGTVGERAVILQQLMASARKFRAPGRWGASGPSEILNGYHGCTNSVDTPFHSERRDCRTWDEHFKALGDVMLNALCSQEASSVRWRKSIGLTLHTPFKLKVRDLAYAGDEEKKLFLELFALEKPASMLPDPSTLAIETSTSFGAHS